MDLGAVDYEMVDSDKARATYKVYSDKTVSQLEKMQAFMVSRLK